MEALPRYLPGHGYQLSGLDPLRDAVAARLTARGLPTSCERVLVTAGAQQAIALTLRTLVGPGDRVLGSDGWDVDALAATLRPGWRT